MNRAGAALGDATPELCADHIQLIPQHPQEWRIGITLDLKCLTVDRQLHALPPEPRSMEII
jgi:hypothetical protein